MALSKHPIFGFRKLLLVIIFTFFLCEKAYSVETLNLDHNRNLIYFIRDSTHFEAIIDTFNKYTIYDILKDESRFKRVIFKSQFGYDPKTYWYRIRVKNNTSGFWLFRQNDANVAQMEVYQKVKGVMKVQKGGKNLPMSQRMNKFYNPVFDVLIPRDSVAYLYIKIRSKRDFSYEFNFINIKQAYLTSERDAIWLGLLYGIIIIMFIYNFVLFLVLKDRVYIYYCMFLFSGICFNMSGNFGPVYLWPEYPWLNYASIALSFTSVIIFLKVYIVGFLKRSGYDIRLGHLNVFLVFYVAFILVENFYFDSYKYYPNIFPVLLLMLLFLSIGVYRKGYQPARFIVMGLSFITLGQIVYILMGKGIIHPSLITIYADDLGLVAETLMFSLAIGDRLRTLKIEKESTDHLLISQLKENELLKDQLNKELEDQVATRTEELKEANDQLYHMNELLKSHNILLEGNIKEIAKEMAFQKALSYEEFIETFPDELVCLTFLASLKDKKAYKCRKCGNDKYTKASVFMSRKCTICLYVESPLAHTIFSNIKFPLTKAFYIVYYYYTNKGKVSSTKLSGLIQLRQKTCWEFLHRLEQSAHLDEKTKFNLKEGWMSWIEV